MMAAGLAALTLSGCASNDPAPLEQMRLTEQALEQAKAEGGTVHGGGRALTDQYPDAA